MTLATVEADAFISVPVGGEVLPETVPRARFLKSQQTVGALLRERQMIMDVLIALVVATEPARHGSIRLAHQVNVPAAWLNAARLCEKWQQSAPLDQSQQQQLATVHSSPNG